MFRFAGAFLASGLLALLLLALYGPASKQQLATVVSSKSASTPSATRVAAGTPTRSRVSGASVDLLGWVLHGLQGEKSNPTATQTPVARPMEDPRVSAEQHYRLAHTFFEHDNNFEEAIKELDITLRLNPRHIDATFLRGYAYAVTGQPDKALTDINKALQMKPDYAEVYVVRGFVYRFHMADYDRAIADYKKAIALAPTLGWAYSELGYIYYLLEEYDRAIITLDKAVQVSPLFAEAYYNRGMVYSDMDESEKAIKDFTRAIQLQPRAWRAYESRAWEYEYIDNTEAAIEDFKMVIDLSNDPREVKRAREEILALQGT
jgi:tetratricopeptide (TPR) repeat protein